MKPLSRAAATVTTAALAASHGLGTAGHAAAPAVTLEAAQADPVAAAEHVLSGSTVRPGGRPVDNISVTARDTTTGEVTASALSYGGVYDLHLPAGSYTLAYQDLGGRFVTFDAPDVLVVDGPSNLPVVTLYRPSPVVVTRPTVHGSPHAGYTLTVSDGEWTADGRAVTLSHSWLLDGEPVAEGATFVVLASHVGHTLTAVVEARAHEAMPTPVLSDDVAVVEAPTTTRVTRSLAQRTRKGSKVRVSARVTSAHLAPAGVVELVDKGKVLASRRLQEGAATLVAKGLSAGRHKLVVRYRGDAVAAPSRATTKVAVPRR